MPRAGVEGAIGFQHRDGREIEIALPVGAALAYGAYDAGRLAYGVPVDAVFSRGEDVRVEPVAWRGQSFDEKIHRAGIIPNPIAVEFVE